MQHNRVAFTFFLLSCIEDLLWQMNNDIIISFQDFFFYIQNMLTMILNNICSILKLVNNTCSIASDIIIDSANIYILHCEFFNVQLIMISNEILWNWWLVYFLHHASEMCFVSAESTTMSEAISHVSFTSFRTEQMLIRIIADISWM